MRPLEKRFPTLYYDISDMYDPNPKKLDGSANPDYQKTSEARIAKKTPPSLNDVIQKVLDSHKISSQGVSSDLAVTISEFLGLDTKALPKSDAVMTAAPSASKVPSPPAPEPLSKVKH